MALDVKSAVTGGVGVVALGALALLGIDVYEPLPPDTPVIYAFLVPAGERAGWYYATFPCIRDGHSLDGYVDDRAEAVHPINPFAFVNPQQSEVTTLARARRLVHDGPAWRAADPRCVEVNGFMASRSALLTALLR